MSSFVVAAWLAGWYGSDDTPFFFWPFVILPGGVAQFIAAFYCLAARDTLASVMHMIWGAFWISLSVLYLLMSVGVVATVARYTANPALAIWLLSLCVLTYMGAAVSYVRNWVLFLTLALLGTAALLGGIGWFTASKGLIVTAAYFIVVSDATALYRVFTYLLVEAYGDTLTVGKRDMILPRYRTTGMASMITAGYKEALHEPGVIKGN